MVVPEAPHGCFYQVRVAESRAVVVDEGKLVGRQDVRGRLLLDAGVDFAQLALEILGQTLVDAAFGVLGNVDGLAEREGAVAGNIFYSTHGVGAM